MMYSNNFVVVVKSNGKVLREKSGCVLLPFGSEYTILLKNLDSRKAVAKVSVDGSDVVDSSRIIVPANSSVELKGKMRGTKVKHSFKFIKKTKEISKYRGDRLDDGLIRVEYWFEKVQVQMPEIVWPPVQKPWPIRPIKYDDGGIYNIHGTYNAQWTNTTDGGTASSSCNYSNSNGGGSKRKLNSKTVQSNFTTSLPVGSDGLTVQGSRTNQDFVYGNTKTLESSSSVIVLHLRGNSKKGKIVKPVGVKTRFRCSTCGRKSKSSAKWCSNCGTNLEM